MSSVPLAARLSARIYSMVVLMASGIGLAGCVGMGDGAMSSAFVDPAKYELFDCKQLEAERKSLEARTVELQGYIDKARTGTAGELVGEVAYRNDYISTRASLKLANEAWERGRCAATIAPTPAAGAPRQARQR